MLRSVDRTIAIVRVATRLCIGLLVGCASQPVEQLPTSAQALPTSHSIDGLPFHPQVEDQCGPASLATMLAARDVQVDPATLRGKLYIPDKKGAVPAEMVARARRYGQLVYPLDPELMAVLTEVAAGNPVLVLQNLGFDWMPRWHFSVVIGFDRSRDIVVLRSGDEPQHEVPFSLFVKTWNPAGRWAVVIVQPGQLPASAREDPFVRAASELEQVGEREAALQAYTAAIAVWPDNEVALFGAGNTAYATGRYTEAREFFAAFVKKQPSSAVGWNNLAFSLQKLDCYPEAITAVACAVSLAPDDSRYLVSQSELEAIIHTGGGTYCQVPLCPISQHNTVAD